MNVRELGRASGYLFVLVPPALLAASVMLGMPMLSFIGLIGVMPLLRLVFGDAPDRQPEWSEGIAQALELLPIVAAVAFIVAITYVKYALWRSQWTADKLVWLGFSLWASCIFASCVSHELLHRRGVVSRTVGRVLSGVVGYPLQEHEHRAHHSQAGRVETAECPAVDESVWRFTARRAKRVLRAAWEGDVLAAARRGHRLAGGLPLSVGSTVVTAAGFWLAAGLRGLLLYAIVALAVAWTLQAITYVQHWGLGSEHTPDGRTGNHGWEDRCQVQAWLTLGISYHQAHHHRIAVPYYRQNPLAGAPLQPGGYVSHPGRS